MKMQVRDALLPVLAAVDDHAIAALVNPQLTNQLAHDAIGVADDGFVLFREFVHADNVLFRHDEHMHGRLRLNVVDGDNQIVLIHFSRRDFPGDDLAKDAVAQILSTPSSLFYPVRRMKSNRFANTNRSHSSRVPYAVSSSNPSIRMRTISPSVASVFTRI